MKIKNDFVLHNIADNYFVVPLGEESTRIGGMISLNETGAFLWDKLKTEQTVETLLALFLDEYDVSEEEAKKSIHEFVDELEKNCFLE